MFRIDLPGRRLVLAVLGSYWLFVSIVMASQRVEGLPAKNSGLIQYQAADGTNYVALVLSQLAAPKLADVPHDHVVIVDTSASQSGDFRIRSIAVAAEVCRQLPSGDRVQLLATDVGTEVLTAEFVSPGSAELQAAFDRLEDRVPLGASNVELALRTALQKFSGDRARSVLYIGDGFSTAQLIQTEAFIELMKALRSAAVPVNSFAIGPRIDLLLLGSLAQHSGGLVVVDEFKQNVDRAAVKGDLTAVAGQLVRATVAPILYPTRLTTIPEAASLLPEPLPPVRFDRETVLLGKGLDGNKIQVKLTGTLRGQARELSWQLTKEEMDVPTGFVGQAWSLAETTKGVGMPWAGRDMMVRSQEAFSAQLETLEAAGAEFLRRKDVRQVEEIVKTLQQLDPNNQAAPLLLKSARKLKVDPVKPQRLLVPADDKPAKAKADESAAATGTALQNADDKSKPLTNEQLDELETQSKVQEEQLTIDVNISIEAAHEAAQQRLLDSSGDGRDILKRQLDIVEIVAAATDLSPELRQGLNNRLVRALQQLDQERETFEQQRAALERRYSQQEAMRKLMNQAERDEEQIDQLIYRVRDQLRQRFPRDSDDFVDGGGISRVAVELDPYSGVPNLDVFDSNADRAVNYTRRLGSFRRDNLLALLRLIERSLLPYSVEVPILWPNRERWQWLADNSDKGAWQDLQMCSERQDHIIAELNKPTELDIANVSLDEVRELLMERHGFDVMINKQQLQAENIATESPDFTLKVSQISLKNALKLLLDAKNLTYLIENDVLKITTKADGEMKRAFAAYNRLDRPLPKNSLLSLGGGGRGM